jgi:hypothetical protein
VSGETNERPFADLSDDALRRAYAETRESVADAAHPSEDDWERFVMREMGAAERDKLAAHVAVCAACASILSAVTEVERSAAAFDRGADTRVRRRPIWPFGMAVAAALALFMIRPWRTEETARVLGPPQKSAAVRLQRQSSATEFGVPPQPQEQSALRSATAAEAVPVEPHGVVSTRPLRFRFRVAADASAHVVRLYSDAGRLLWTSPSVSEDVATLPESVALPPGHYYWQVLAQPRGTRDVKDLVGSPQLDFEVRY